MRYEIIMEKDNYALLASGNNLGALALGLFAAFWKKKEDGAEEA